MVENANANYELRRQARGSEPPPADGLWRRRLRRAGAVSLAVVLCAVGSFVWLRLTRVYTVSARVQAAVVELSPVVDARLLELNVGEGEQVRRGQVLARLDDTGLRAAIEAAEATRALKQSQHAEAQARHRLTQAEVASDVERAEAAAQIAAARVAGAAAAENARRARLVDEIRAAEAQYRERLARHAALERGPRTEDIQAAQARVEAAEALQALYRIELEQSRKLATEGIDSQHLLEVRRTRVVTQEKALKQAQLEFQRMQAGATAEALEASAQALANRAAQLALTRSGSNDVVLLHAELAVREAEHRESLAQLKHAEAQKTAIEVAQERMHTAAAELRRAEAEERGRRAALKGRDFVSPVDGIVTRTFVRVGEVCRKGVPCILVADNDTPRWIDGFLRESDAMLVDVGQRARVRAPANTGDYADAVVAQVGLHTQSLDEGEAGGATAPRYMQPERVWVRLRPLKPLKGDPVTGTSVRAVIRVR